MRRGEGEGEETPNIGSHHGEGERKGIRYNAGVLVFFLEQRGKLLILTFNPEVDVSVSFLTPK